MYRLIEGLLLLAQAGAVCAVVLIVTIAVYRWQLHPISKYPGPFLAKFTDLYSLYFVTFGKLHIQQRLLHQRYGPIVRVGPNKLIFNSPSAFHEIYQSRNVQKNAGYPATDPVPGHSHIFTTVDKDIHRLKRKALSPGFSDQFIRRFENVILKSVDEFIDALQHSEGQQVEGEWSVAHNMSDRCKYYTLDIMGDFGFGRSFNVQLDPANRGIIYGLQAGGYTGGLYSQYAPLRRLNVHKYYKVKGAWTQERHGAWVRGMINERLGMAQDAKPDLFSFVSETKDPETGAVFKRDDLWAESRFLLIAGSDTSSTVLSSVFFYLSRYPQCHQKLLTELAAAFAAPDDIRLGPALSGCHFLRAVIDEAMRLSPPVANALWRQVCSPGQAVDGEFMAPGVEIGASMYAVFHSPSIFPEPDSFIPERFIEGGQFPDHFKATKDAFKPFSVGSRNCAGINLAYAEMLLLVAKSIWMLDFKRPEGPLASVGGGSQHAIKGRQVVDEFQMKVYITGMHEGPYLQFRPRTT